MALYKLSRVVDNGTFHKIIETRGENLFEVVEGVPICCKLLIRGLPPPLAISVMYKVKGDLKVFISQRNPEPH